jgi:apolipoprotein N-acyltransferase
LVWRDRVFRNYLSDSRPEKNSTTAVTSSAEKHTRYGEDTSGIILNADFQPKTGLLPWAEDFIFAGTSAVLLLIANLFSSYWYFCFLALLPLIYRISRASLISSIRLGFLFGFSFSCILAINPLIISPLATALKIIPAVLVFTLFAGSVGWIRLRYGFNPVLVAVLWAGFEFGLVNLGFYEGLFGQAKFSLPVFSAISTIFGFIIISFIIVLANSLIILAIEKVVSFIKESDTTLRPEALDWYIGGPCRAPGENLYLIPESRAPPVTIIAFVNKQN